jgi:hypothetical protein
MAKHLGVRSILLAALFTVAGAQAAPATHRERAQQAETLGQMGRAAVEYEAAWSDDRAPELLYRLGIVRRRLREYRRAKEAFRGYLRALPDGPLRDEVERQIAQLNILIEAEAQDAPVAPSRGHASAGPSRPAGARPAAPGGAGAAKVPAPPGEAMPKRAAAPADKGSAPSPERTAAAPPATPAQEGTTDEMGAARDAVPIAPPAEVRRAMPDQVRAAPAEVAAPSRRAAPAAATQASSPAAAPERSRAVPWLAAGAALAAAGGAVLWWDGDRVARDLDARFAMGDLTAADTGRYSRSRGEGIAGRALVAAALGLAGAAVLLW